MFVFDAMADFLCEIRSGRKGSYWSLELYGGTPSIYKVFRVHYLMMGRRSLDVIVL